MRVRIQRFLKVDDRNRAENATTPVAEEVDIPARPFLTVGGISGLVAALLTVVTFWFVTKPDAQQRRDLELYRYRAEMLDRAFQIETAAGRRTSINVLLAAGLLEFRDTARISGYLNGRDTLPRWPTRGGARDVPVKSGSAGRSGTDSTPLAR